MSKWMFRMIQTAYPASRMSYAAQHKGVDQPKVRRVWYDTTFLSQKKTSGIIFILKIKPYIYDKPK